ncbi:uncharacterized protein TRUGW13939_07483 [Talaromyces rugulosus]|uniref:Zn(2)-C6 fungal-type domain-containing protein n=1 Tax=Talaromyces rugulosus TaxID=121627 RepID=A0A7H8R1W9_TALRU|nr:uncharacterized protein TRUGW13939_07483 [Talaromyces rugulosus]QKX60339.1 hypothetical protein TRUGW13939_07483 [Talaromyces rugulosus]
MQSDVVTGVFDKTNNVRKRTHACERCKLKHSKCEIIDGHKKCINCELCKSDCKDSIASSLQIRFSKFSQIETKDSPESAGGARDEPCATRSVSQRRPSSRKRPASVSPVRVRGNSFSDHGRPGSVKRWHDIPDVAPFHGIDRSAAGLNGPSATPETPAIIWGVTTDSPIMPQATNDLDKLGNESSQTPAEPWLESAPQSWTFTPGSCQGSTSTKAVRQSISSCESSYATVSANLDAVYSHKDSNTTCIWPLTDAEEDELLKHFMADLVYWVRSWSCSGWMSHTLNFTSSLITAIPKCIFEHTLSPGLTVIQPYSMLFLPFRPNSYINATANPRADKYQRLCLERLIPALSDTTNTLQDTGLVSATILRLLEEMTVVLRQEIFVANMTKRGIERIEDHCNFDLSLEPASDTVWTYRIMAHAAKVTSFVYSPGGVDTEKWDEYWQYLNDWTERKPVFFSPTYDERTSNSTTLKVSDGKKQLPKISFAYDRPVAAHQYFYLCRILLLAYDPRIPKLGLGGLELQHQRDECIRSVARTVCSIGITNNEHAHARITAGLAVAMCGELFADPEETPILFEIISQTERHLGWPCLKVSHKLKAFWNL